MLEAKQWPNCNAADRSFFCRRFEPRSGEYAAAAAAAAANSQPTRVRIADQKVCVSGVTIRPADAWQQ